jgi:hypothetical protein
VKDAGRVGEPDASDPARRHLDESRASDARRNPLESRQRFGEVGYLTRANSVPTRPVATSLGRAAIELVKAEQAYREALMRVVMPIAQEMAGIEAASAALEGGRRWQTSSPRSANVIAFPRR